MAIIFLSLFSKEAALAATAEELFIPPPNDKERHALLEQVPSSMRATFLSESDPVQNSKGDLPNYSITLDQRGKRIARPPSYFHSKLLHDDDDGSPVIRKGAPKYCFATRPGSSNIVAVIETVENDLNYLNPLRGFNYGPIPRLSQLTTTKADILWGKPAKQESLQNEEKRIYHLVSRNVKSEISDIFIDCRFCNSLLCRYKISGPTIDSHHPFDSMNDWNAPHY